MLCLSQTTGYAIMALACLDKHQGTPIVTRDIADATTIPMAYLSKILLSLSRRRLVNGKRGFGGGFVLAKPAEQIALIEVVEAIEGPNWLPSCLLGTTPCHDEQNCPTFEFWQRQRAEIQSELQRLTLRDVARFSRREKCENQTGGQTPGESSTPCADQKPPCANQGTADKQ